MNSPFVPRGRKAIPEELMQFGMHLVYAEGTKSEPFYIENIKKRISSAYKCNANDINIIPVSDNKSHITVELVKYAERDVKRRLKAGKRIDHVWVLFDKDDFDDYEDAHKRIIGFNDSKDVNADGFEYDSKTGIAWHSCPSNQCFELWYCLHFDFYNIAHDRKHYISFLEKRLSVKNHAFTYEKNKENMYDILERCGGSIDDALKYAKKLEAQNGINNPSTGVYKLIEYFGKYLKRR